MSGYGKNNDPNDFTSDEKVNLALKVALGRIQTDLNRNWYQEPNDFIPKTPSENYRFNIPSYNEMKNYLLIDPDVDGNGTSKVTNITVDNVMNLGVTTKSLSEIIAGFDSSALGGKLCRSENSLSNSSERTYVDANNNQIIGLGPNMFTRYKYYKGVKDQNGNVIRHLTGKNWSNNSNDSVEPNNALLTFKGNGSDDSSTARFIEGINNARKATADSAGKTFYNDLINLSVPLELIHPDNKDDLTKKHPFIKMYIQVPTYTSEPVTSGDNIAFHNPVIEKALGDGQGYIYRITSWSTADNAWTIQTTSYSETLFFLNNPGLIVIYGQDNNVSDPLFSQKYAPLVSYLSYTGETFSDGIISQGDTLPAVEVSNDKDLFINTSDNTIHRLNDDNGTKTWVGIGGSGGGLGTSDVTITGNLTVTGTVTANGQLLTGGGGDGGGGGSSRNIYSQILDISSNSLNSEVQAITDLSENTLTNNVYEVNNDAKQLIIDYRFFISFIEGSTEITSNISGIEIGVDALFEIYLKVQGNILENTRQFVHLNIHEKYVTFKTVLNISDELIIKNIITSQKYLPFQICVKSHSARSFKLHQTQNNSSRPDNLKITSIGTQGDENNSENNIKHYFANNNVKNSLQQINASTTPTSYQITEQILTDHSINSNITELDIHYRPYVHFDSSTSDNGFNLTDVIIKYNIEISIDGGNTYESIGEEFKRIQYFDNYVDFFIKKKYTGLQSIITLSVKITLTSVLNSNINIHKSDKPSKLEVISYSTFDKNVKTNQVLEYITSNLNGSIVEPNNRSDLNVQNVSEYTDIVYSSTSLNNNIININDISNSNLTSFDVIHDYKPPVNTKKIILKYGLFLTYFNDFTDGIRGNNDIQGYIEWVYTIDDVILPMTLRRDFIDLTENYCFNETIIDLGTSDDISSNKFFSWTYPKTIKIYARCIINNNNYTVIAHKSQLSGGVEGILKEPYFEIICIGDYPVPSNSLVSSDTTSDDRIKHNEQNITNALNIIEKLQPKKYIKTEMLFDKNHNFELNEDGTPINFNQHYATETGLIAQDIYNIPELKYVVGGYELDSSGALVEDKYNPLTVRYNDIFVYSIQAIKELKQENDTLKSKLIAMEDKIQSLEEKIN